MHKKTGRIVKGTAEHCGGCRVRFTCPAGHVSNRDYSKGPIPKRISETAIRMLVKYWNGNGGTAYQCKKCLMVNRQSGG